MATATEILDAAESKLKKRTQQAHQEAAVEDGGRLGLKALGYYVALRLARDCYEMGMRDALKAVSGVSPKDSSEKKEEV